MSRQRLIHHVLLGWPTAIVLLIIYVVMAAGASHEKSNTFDEVVHLVAGYSYWSANDYRLHPENGNLPQRWAALPVYGLKYLPSDWAKEHYDFKFPSRSDAYWLTGEKWPLGNKFLYEMGNDLPRMLLCARTMIALCGAVGGALVFVWARRLFGPAGGIIALLLFVFSPTMLAHCALVTSDMMTAVLFLAAVGVSWAMMHRINPWTVIGGGVVVGGLLLSKVSGVFIVPMVLIMLIVRLIAGGPLEVTIGRRWIMTGWMRQLAVLAGAWLVQGVIVVVVIWAAFGLRFEGPNPSRAPVDHFAFDFEDQLIDGGFRSTVFRRLRAWRVLPDAYLYGAAYVAKHAEARSAFLGGRYSVTGFRGFFPYAFAVKTTIPLLLLLIAGVIGALMIRQVRVGSGESRSHDEPGVFYRTTPLWVLFVVYWAVALTSNLNIGHRHILPTYLPLFVLAGAGSWFFRLPNRRAAGAWSAVIVALVGWHVVESWQIGPHYLAYFNQAAGGPRNGYHHLVDSSLDWGQDLPGLKSWMDEQRARRAEPVYFAYFGSAQPGYYGIDAIALPSYMSQLHTPLHPLVPGWYCISATQLQRVYVGNPGPWGVDEEQRYIQVLPVIREIQRLQMGPTDVFVDGMTDLLGAEWQQRGRHLDIARFRRLCEYLLKREPDTHIGHSILIYHLGEAELREAIWEPWIVRSPTEGGW